MATETLADLGLGAANKGGPAWWWDNPFLLKTGRTETRRLGIGLRLGLAVLILSGLLLGGLRLLTVFPAALNRPLPFLPGGSFPALLFVVLSFAHVLLVSNARTSLAVSIGDEARRGTLPDLLLTPLRRGEMLLAMGVGPARGALLVALAGTPIYLLLAQLGGLTWGEIARLLVVLALLSFAPPSYTLPALSGAAPTPDNPLTVQSQQVFGRKTVPNTGVFSVSWLWTFLSVFFFSQVFALPGAAWLSHLLLALHVSLPGGPAGHYLGATLLVFSWPYYVVQIFGEPLDFFHTPLPPLLFVLPLALLNWVGSALTSAAALSAGSLEEMHRLPLFSRAQTLARWTLRAAGFCALGLVWKVWVESGDTASMASGGAAGPGGDAAGLLLLLGGLSLPNVLNRALTVPIRRKDARQKDRLLLRPYAPTLRRGLRRSLRPLLVAGAAFLLACILGGLSPLAPEVGKMAGRILLVALSGIVWALGLRRLLPGPARAEKLVPRILLLGLPAAALSLPEPVLWNLAALSPASGWLSLFPEGPPLLARFPFWTLGHLPSFEVCLLGPALTGLVLAWLSSASSRTAQAGAPLPVPVKPPAMERNAAWTAALLGWVTARTDNPLFTQEMRARTRSGRWADWRFFVPGVLLGSVALALAYPDFVVRLAHIFPFSLLETESVWGNLASVLLLLQCYTLSFRGQVVGETLITRDLKRGLWGFILLTPLTTRQIFWGKVFGQTSGIIAAWAVCGAASLAFYALASPAVGAGQALAAWATGQFLVAALFTFGVGLGAAAATFSIFLKALRGLSTILFLGVIGGSVYFSLAVFPDFSMLRRVLLGSVALVVLSVPLFWFAVQRIALLRRHDIAFGDGTE